jgi:hypothetical protein
VNCEEARALLHEHCDEALEEGLRRRLESHLGACPSCRQALQRVRNLAAVLAGAARVPEPPEGFWEGQRSRILARARGASAPPPAENRSARRPNWLLAGAVGLAAAAVIAAGILIFVAARSANTTGQEIAKKVPQAPPDEAPGVSQAVPPQPKGPEEQPGPVIVEREPVDVRPSPKAAAAVPLPGDPDHLDRMTDENIAAGLAEKPADRVRAFFQAADARLEELRVAIDKKDQPMAEELAQAYSLILRDGVLVVLDDREEPAEDRADAAGLARARAKSDEQVLAGLEGAGGAPLRGLMADARNAAREIAAR